MSSHKNDNYNHLVWWEDNLINKSCHDHHHHYKRPCMMRREPLTGKWTCPFHCLRHRPAMERLYFRNFTFLPFIIIHHHSSPRVWMVDSANHIIIFDTYIVYGGKKTTSVTIFNPQCQSQSSAIHPPRRNETHWLITRKIWHPYPF